MLRAVCTQVQVQTEQVEFDAQTDQHEQGNMSFLRVSDISCCSVKVDDTSIVFVTAHRLASLTYGLVPKTFRLG